MCLGFEVSGVSCVWGLTCLGFHVSGIVNGTGEGDIYDMTLVHGDAQ